MEEPIVLSTSPTRRSSLSTSFDSPREHKEVTFSNGDSYSGNFKNNLFDGDGTYVFSNGSVFKGVYVKGKPSGYGTLFYFNGSKYEGTWKDGRRHGKGSLICENGNLYEGEWSEGKQTGFGKYIWSERSAKFNNCVYVGNFLNGKFHGQGTYLFSNGDKFQGNFVNGLIHGSGTYTSSGGDTITGTWSDDLLHGFVTLYCSIDRSQWENEYESGKLKSTEYKGQVEDNFLVVAPVPRRKFSIDESSFSNIIQENQLLKRKLEDTFHQVNGIETNLKGKETKFMGSLEETRAHLETLQNNYEMKIFELTTQLEEEQRKVDRLKRDLQQEVKSAKKILNSPPIQKARSYSLFNSFSDSNVNFSTNHSASEKICIDLQKDKINFHEIVGKGATGVIYRSSINGFTFATKCLNTEFMLESETFQIRKEIEIMKQLTHNNIVRFLGYSWDASTVMIYMEYYLKTLNDVIATRRTKDQLFTHEESCWFGYQISQGLQYLHNLTPMPIIHRDLKSENIFYVESRNTPPILKIGDFGEAKILTSKLTHTINLGTDEFRAPEVFGMMNYKLEKGHNEKADIWSLGMVLFEIISLDIPYRNSMSKRFSIAEFIEKGIRPTFPQHVMEEPGWEPILSVFQQCTEKEPTKRPTAKEVTKTFKKLYDKFLLLSSGGKL